MKTYSDEILRLAELKPIPIREGEPHTDLANRLCGDRISVSLTLNGENIEAMRWHAEGCAILCASAAYAAQLLPGKKYEEGLHLIQDFFSSFDQQNEFCEGALAAVYTLPGRYKCALLPWQAAENFLRELKR